MSRAFRIRFVGLLWSALSCAAQAQGADEVEFVRDVQPIFAKHCVRCHGAAKQEAGLRLDRKQSAFRDGDSFAPVLRPGKSAESPLVQFVSRADAELQMPPAGARLTANEVETLRRWIDQGARWPDDLDAEVDPTRMHWSFQPLRRPPLPSIDATDPAQSPIDRFITAQRQAHGLSASPAANRRILIRRLAFDLLGLPPTPEEVESFVHDPDPQAYERLVDDYLASPRLGERWARHWLDVARFAESNGFEMNQHRPHAWRFRDYVIRAFNVDKPYDDFIREQLAGDQLGADEATGFLVGGPWDQVKSPDPVLTAQQRADELHDLVSTTSSTFLGLTVGCARCHAHKFDPVPQTDYYALKACFAGVEHGNRATRPVREVHARLREAERENVRRELADLESVVVAAPVNARLNVERFPPVTTTRLRFTIRTTNSAQPCLDELEVWSAEAPSRNVALAATGAKATASSVFPNSDLHRLEHVNDGRYGNSRSWISNEAGMGWVELEFPRAERIDRVLWGRDREQKFTDRLPTDYVIEVRVGDDWQSVASASDHVEPPGRSARRTQLEAQLAELRDGPLAYAGLFTQPSATMRLQRGDPMQPREAVAPGSLTQLGRPLQLTAESPEHERRLRLAQWIAHRDNPLTARVIVNRLWQQHFGEGLVSTPSDLGVNGGRPSHPELLDWLASELIDHGWSLKHVHRLIVLSATYRQASTAREDALRVDAANRWLWRFSPRRIEAESLRDAILAVCGNLDTRMGGPGFDLFEPNTNYVKVYTSRRQFGPTEWRRMVYQSKPRMQLDDTFGAFDCPDAGQIAPKRTRSTTALQALNLLNSPFMIQQSERFAARLCRDAGNDLVAQIHRGFHLALLRKPSDRELAAATELVRVEGLPALCRGLLNANEFLLRD